MLKKLIFFVQTVLIYITMSNKLKIPISLVVNFYSTTTNYANYFNKLL